MTEWQQINPVREWRTEHGAGREFTLRRCPVCHAAVPDVFQEDHSDWHRAIDNEGAERD